MSIFATFTNFLDFHWFSEGVATAISRIAKILTTNSEIYSFLLFVPKLCFSC